MKVVMIPNWDNAFVLKTDASNLGTDTVLLHDLRHLFNIQWADENLYKSVET